MEKIKLLLGKRIRELRDKQNISQQQLAEMMGIDQRNLSKIECGKAFPTKCLDKICNSLNISLSQIFEFEHTTMTKQDLRDYISNSLNQMSEEQLKMVYRIVCSMLK